MIRIRCLVCDRTYPEPEVNFEECPHCFNSDMTQTEFVPQQEKE